MNHFYQLSIFLFLLFVLPLTNVMAGNEAPLMNVAAAPGDLSATITGDSVFCAGSAGVIVFTGSGGSAPYTFTYQVGGGAVQSISATGVGSTASVQVNTSAAGNLTYRITSIKGATGKATLVDISRVITVLAAPVVDFSFTGTACSGSPVPFASSVQGAGMYSYLWDFGDGQTSTEQDPIHEFSATGCGNTDFTVTLTVTDGNGCSATRSHSVTVLQKPDISFSDINFPFGEPFDNCGSASAAGYTISVGNTSLSAGCINSYRIDWGDGSAPVAGASFPASHTYAGIGAFEMVITAQGSNGCSNAITYIVRNLNNPSVGITSPGTTTNLCAPTAPLGFEIAKWGTNSPGTTYRVDYGDGSPLITFTQEQLKASAYYNMANPAASANYPIPHSYLLPNCPNGPYMVRLTATNACSSTEATVNNITVFNKTAPDFTVAAHACVNSSVAITNTSIPGYNSACTQTSIYTWDFGDGSAQVVTSPSLPKNTSHTYTTPGEYTIRLSAKNICGESIKTQVITIDPPLTASLTGTGAISGTVSVCQDAPMPVITFTGTNGTSPYIFTYRINGGPLLTATTLAGSSNVTVPVFTTATGSFTYTLVNVSDASPSACTQTQTGAVTVVVSAPPTATISGNLSACLNDASPVITFTGSGGTRPYIFTYTINGGTEKSTSTSASSNSATVAVPTTTAGVFKYKLIGVQDSGAASCTGAVNATTTVTINPRPDAMTLPDYEYCNGEVTAVIPFSNAVAGTTYRWSNNNTSIGLTAGGNGNIPSFTARNNTNTPVSATITVIPSVNGCDGASQTFTITVYPSAVLFSQGAQTICSGSNTAAVTLSSPTGAAISWSASVPAGLTGAVTGGTNIIPVQTLVNTTSAPLAITYTATAALPVSDPCAGTSYSYTITVNPRPAIVQTFAMEICSGSAFTVSPQAGAGNSIPSGTKYTWSAPVISPSGAITGAGAQATPQASISQTLVNTTSAVATATYTITPIANGCAGNSFTIEVSVLPLPTATIAGSATVCQNATEPSVTFTGSNGTAPYTFSYKINSGAVQTTTTLSGNSITVPVSTTTAGSYVYTLVSVQDKGTTGCIQPQSGSVTVVVSAPPTATISGNMTACLNDASPVITFTGSGGTRPYTFTYNIDGGAVQSIPTSATSNSATVTVPTTAAGVFKYNLVEVKDSGTGNCSRILSASATVTVNELPAAMTLTDYEYCNGEVTPGITFTNVVSGTTYRWTNSNPSIGLPASGTGSISSFTALNATSAPITSTITVTPSVNGCNGVSQSFKITVQPSPSVTFSSASQTICSGESTTAVTLSSSTAGAQFSWSAVQPAGITGVIASGTNTIPVQTLVNTTSAPITVTYKAKASTSGSVSCSGSEFTYNITVNPKPQLTETFATEICSGSVFTVSPQAGTDNSIPSGTKYTWSAPVISPLGAITGAAAQALPQASISQMLVNSTSTIATVTYTVIPIANGCAGNPFTIEVSVFPSPKAAITGNTTVCQDEEMPRVTFTGSNGTAPYTFSYKINSGAVQIISTDATSSSATVPVPTDIAGSFTYSLVNVQDKGTMGCMQPQSGSVTVEVSVPSSATIAGSATACLNNASPVITFTGSGGTRPYTFTYNINGGEAKSISTDVTSNSATLDAATTTAGVFTYRLIGVRDSGVGGCTSTVADSAVVTVNELPAPMTLADYEYCSGEVTPGITFTNAVLGTTCRWINSNPSIGLPASGTGNISSFTALNTTSAPITSTITVTPSVNGCNGVSQSFKITVQPSPSVTFSSASQTICSGESTTVVTLSSSTAGAQFSWSAVQPAGITGVSTSGTSTIPVQTLTNTTSAPITVTYKAKASTSGSVSCSGSEFTYNITVNPKPQLTETFATEICSGSAFTVSPQASSENSIPLNTMYTWSAPVISPAGSITGASAQTLPQGSISQMLVNSNSAVATATYTVTPTANGCAGNPFIIVVSVLPIVTVDPVSDLTVCNGGQVAAIDFSGKVAGTVYRWTSDNTATGIAGSGTDHISAFTAVNTSSSPVQSTITVTPVLINGNASCEGASLQFRITVNPAAQVDAVQDQKVCSGEPLTIGFTSPITGAGTTYEWTNSNTAIGLGASGSGSLSFVPVNTGNASMSAAITVTPVYLNNGVSCKGSARVFTITVDPEATVVKPVDQQICNASMTSMISFVGNNSNAVYQWTNDNSSIGLAGSGTGSIPSFRAVNTGTVPVVASITVIPMVNGCSGTPATFTITVNPTPVILTQPKGSVVCLGEKPALLSLAVKGMGNPSYQWYSNTIASNTGGLQIPNATGVSYAPRADVAGSVFYYCVISFANDCNAVTTAPAEVTILPNPVISAVDQDISSGELFMVTPAWGNGNIVPPGTAYIWSDPVISPAGAVSGAAAQTVPQAIISQRLVNTTQQPATVTYTVFPVSGACTGASFKVTVYVDSPLLPHVSVTPITCYGESNGRIDTDIQGGAPFAQGAPYTVLWTGPDGYTSTDASISDLAPGVYHLSVTDSRGKQISAEATVMAPEVLMVVTDEKKDVSCYGAADARISIIVKGGTGPYQASWTKDTMPFALTEDIANLAPGTYEVTVKDANGCAPQIMSWVISQPDPLTVALTGKSDIKCYGDSSGYIAVAVTGGVPAYRYHWTGPNNFSSADKDLSHLAAGDYYLEVTDVGGCTQSLAVTLTEPSPLAVAAQTTPISCYGANNATIRLNITGGTPPYQADWNNYASGTYQDNLSAGDYTIVITDAYQCQTTTTVKIPEAQVLRMNPEVKNVSCYGARNGSISLNFETTLKSIILTWSDNVRSGTTRNNIGPGVYTVSIKGESLCVLNRTFVITEPAPLVLSAAVTDITNCSNIDGGAIDLMVTGGTPPYSYAWSNGAVSQDLVNVQAGNYAITVTDAEGCAQVAQYTIRRPALLVADVETTIDFNCASGDVKAVCTAKVSGGVTPYQIKWSTGEVSGQNNELMETRQSGIVVLTVTDQTGCSVSRSFSLDVPSPGIVSWEADCNAHVFQFDGVPPSESEANTYSWDFGDGTVSGIRNPQHTYSAAGTYSVRLTITTATGCIAVYHEVVDAALPPVVGIDKEPRFCPGDSVLVHGTGAATYRWNDGTSEDGIWISREGNYSVTGTSAAGCSATYEFKASYYDLIGYTIQSDQQEVSSGANRIHFWSEDIPYSAYRWDFGDGQSGQGAETFHSYEISDDGYIDVNLTVVNPNGCEEKATKRIWKSVTAIANTFTPNGDGFNDIYLKGWQIQVFNRNGVLMYQGDTGWDGKHEGRLVDNDTYFVIIYDSTQMGAKYKTGYVTVLR